MRNVEVVAYNPKWPVLYRAEAGRLIKLLGAELVRLHHIGSTSIPCLAAKPLIDMLAEVRHIEQLDELNPRLIAAGYTPKGEYGIPGRRYFFKGSQEIHTHHLHAFQEGNPEIARHLLFRDYMRSHPAEAMKYGELKQLLAARFPDDIDAYCAGKDAFIKDIDHKAAAWAAENPL